MSDATVLRQEQTPSGSILERLTAEKEAMESDLNEFDALHRRMTMMADQVHQRGRAMRLADLRKITNAIEWAATNPDGAALIDALDQAQSASMRRGANYADSCVMSRSMDSLGELLPAPSRPNFLKPERTPPEA